MLSIWTRYSLVKSYLPFAQAWLIYLTSLEISDTEFGRFSCFAEPGLLLLVEDADADAIPEPVRLRFKSSVP